MPVLEAMSCGAVVIGSNTTSVPEVIQCKDSLFNPYCIEEIAYRMGYISSQNLGELSKQYNNEYGEYLLKVSKLKI